MNELGEMIDAHTIRFKRLLPGPIERVWEYLTKPDSLATWLAPGEFDPREGGQVELRFDVREAPDRAKAGTIIRGVVTRCEPPLALAYTWVDASSNRRPEENPVPDSVVTFELEARGENVLPVLTHRRLPATLAPSFGAGWHTHLSILQARLGGEEPEAFLTVYNRMLPRYKREGA